MSFISFFKKLFSGADTPEPKARTLTRVHDVQINDIIKFNYLAQADLSNQRFTVVDISTYDLGGEGHKKTVFTLEGTDEPILLAVVKQGHKEYLECAKKIYPDTVAQIFEIEKFASIFDADSGTNHHLTRIGEPDILTGWTAPQYAQEKWQQAYIAPTDYRHRQISNQTQGWTAMDYGLFISNDRQYAVQTEVYDGGRTDVYVFVYLPLEAIEEFWAVAK